MSLDEIIDCCVKNCGVELIKNQGLKIGPNCYFCKECTSIYVKQALTSYQKIET